MNDVTKDQKDRVMKTLAVLGFAAVIVLGVWLSIQIVSLMPQAFSSLASIADGVYNYQEVEELTVETDESTVSTAESFVIDWDPLTASGQYGFSYTCTEGVAVTLTDDEGNTFPATCDEVTILGPLADTVEVAITSERQRVSDVTYAIHFIPEDERAAEIVSENMVTVINASIPEPDVVTLPEPEEETDDEIIVEEDDDTTEEDDDTATETDTPAYVDLSVSLAGVGVLDQNNNFIRRANIHENDYGAFQFRVENIGTQTSDAWSFSATLTSGIPYTSPVQVPLRPGEGVLFTLGYGDVGEDGIHLIGVTLQGGNDSNTANNSFSWAVSITD